MFLFWKIDVLFLLINTYNYRLLWLNISHNEVPKMSARVFARVSVLRVLNLNSNKITSLDANSFRGMRFMRRLYFADNQISRVGRGAFKAVSRYVNNCNLMKGLFKDHDAFDLYAKVIKRLFLLGLEQLILPEIIWRR